MDMSHGEADLGYRFVPIFKTRDMGGGVREHTVVAHVYEIEDAAKIAAVDDLLAALRECVEAMRRDEPSEGWLEFIHEGRKAIAKAEGKGLDK